MRGGPAFAVSLILSSLEPALRAAAELGAWQIISPVSALGRVEVVGGLYEVQEKVHLSMDPWQYLEGRRGNGAVSHASFLQRAALQKACGRRDCIRLQMHARRLHGTKPAS